MRSRLICSILFGLSTLYAQLVVVTPPRASLWIQVDESGHQHVFLNHYGPAVPAELVEAFAESVGCRTADRSDGTLYPNRPEVDCIPPSSRAGLKSTIRWPLSRLNRQLAAAGIHDIDLNISHGGKGYARISPAMESTEGIFGWSHHLALEDGNLPDVALETGFGEGSAWLLLLGAVATMLSPLALAGVRSGGIPTLHAAVRTTTVLVAAGWMWIVLVTGAPDLIGLSASSLPGPAPAWTAAGLGLPMVAAIFLGTFILRPKYEKVVSLQKAAMRVRLLFWGGISGAGLLLALMCLFHRGGSIFWIGILGFAGFFLGILQRYRVARGMVGRLAEGPLLERVRQLAAKAGTHVRAVQIILSEFDAPTAFAGRDNKILVSQALLRDLSRNEVDAVVAHEISHLRRRHTDLMRLVMMVLPATIMASFFAPGVLLWAPLMIPPGFLMLMAIRRNQELTADADAARLTGGPEPFIRGLARASLGNGIPLDWSRWVGLVMPHPPTMARFQALAAAAGLSPVRVQELIGSAAAPAEDRYEVPGVASSGSPGAIYSQHRRAWLKLVLSLLAYIFPIAYSIVIPQIIRPTGVSQLLLATAELACGASLFYLLYEWIVASARSEVRKAMRARLAGQGVDPADPGFFVGFSPSSKPALYDGMYDFEWGLVRFEGSRLVYRGDSGTFSARREEVARLWLDPGPASWTAKPMVSFELECGSESAEPRGFFIRPFDHAFGPLASGAGRKLFDAATAWRQGRNGTSAESSLVGASLSEYPNPPRQPDSVYKFAVLLKALLKLTAYVAGGVLLCFDIFWNWDLGVALTSLFMVWGLVVFAMWPSIRRWRAQS